MTINEIMDEYTTGNLAGNDEVWRFDSGLVVVVAPGTQVSDDDDAVFVGTVAEVRDDDR